MRLLILYILFVLFSIPLAQAKDSDCAEERGAVRTKACTKIIESKLLFGKDISNNKLALVYLHRGYSYSSQNLHEKALSDYDQSIRLDTKNKDVYLARGTIYGVKKLFDKAISDYTQAIRLDPKFTVAYYNRGLEYMEKYLYEQALSDFNQAIQLAPNISIFKSARDRALNKLKNK